MFQPRSWTSRDIFSARSSGLTLEVSVVEIADSVIPEDTHPLLRLIGSKIRKPGPFPHPISSDAEHPKSEDEQAFYQDCSIDEHTEILSDVLKMLEKHMDGPRIDPGSQVELPSNPPPRSLLWLLAISCGISVANLYYNQPLLILMADGFQATRESAGIVSLLSQLGYAIGLFFLVPLGDVLERRRLIMILLGLVGLFLVTASIAPSLQILAFLSLAIGCTTVVPQVLIPYAARLTPTRLRSRTVSTLMTGLLLGVLLSRSLAGGVGQIWGWRVMYGLAAGLMLLLSILLRVILKPAPPAVSLGYLDLLSSVIQQIPTQPLLRHSAAVAFLLFTSFGGFWTLLGYHLQKTFQFETWAIGVFGLIGAAGVVGASSTGRWVSLYGPRTMITFGLLTLLVGHSILLFGQWTLACLVVGLIVLDFGAQIVMVSNQSQVYSLPAEIHGRLNTVYMVCVFLGMSSGTFLGLRVWAWGGWLAVCSFGFLTGAGALLTHFILASRPDRIQK